MFSVVPSAMHGTRRLSSARPRFSLLLSLRCRTAALLAALTLAVAPRVEAADDSAAPKNQELTDLDKEDASGPSGAVNARPWAQGISEPRQAAARARFQEANALLRDSAFANAAQKYAEALSEWDHPGIHYNMALALINLDRPLEVREHLKKATAFGAAPLDQARFDHAQSYLKLIENQLTPLTVQCDVPDAVVRFDDRQLFRGPGRFEGFVLPGEHLIRASKPGFEPTVYQRTLLPGKPMRLHLGLYTQGELTRKLLPGWVPTLVTGVGAAAGATGALLLLQADSKYKEYDHEISTRPECENGCSPDAGLRALRDSAKRYRTLGTVLAVSGGTLLVGGVTLLIVNAAAAQRESPEELDRRMTWTAVVTPSYVGLSGGARF
ncbi:MAG TPA: hypothetical protein VFQ35_12995 [Polyangiaceae bacterium]|nr:hypothetical protein [Polyangiaceae bacterium]